MKKYSLAAIALLICFGTFAQNKDEIIFKAMKDELARNMKELKVENVDRPWFTSYALFDGKTLSIKARLGSLLKVDDRPIRSHGVRLMLGDYACTSDCEYNGRYLSEVSGTETDYDQIRREFWITNDFMYKRMSTDLSSKQSLRKQRNRSIEEQNLLDFLPMTTPTTKIVNGGTFDLNRNKWEQNACALSEIFKNYPTLYASQVMVDINDFHHYVTTSEGTAIKIPMSVTSISVEAKVRTDDGSEYTDNLEIYAPTDKTLPSMDALRAQINEFAKNLSAYGTAPVISDFYAGPVLFENETVSQIFSKTLLKDTGILTTRKAEDINTMMGLPFAFTDNASKRSLDKRIGQRVLDNRLTVSNYSTLPEYNGVALLGAYQVDAEGVIPAEELTVIDSGIMKSMLNGRIPTLKSPVSTGSMRFAIDEKTIASRVSPGTLHIRVKGGESKKDLVAQLLKLAKNDGLKYAYIVSRITSGMNGSISYLYKVDVETGERTLVRKADPAQISLGQLKKIAGISNEEAVSNFMLMGALPVSMIYPNAILLENVEVGEQEMMKNKTTPMKNPTERIF